MFVFTITGYLHEDVISGLFNQFIRLFGRQRTKPRVAGFRRLIMGEPKRFGTMFGEELSLTCQSRRKRGPVSRDEGARSRAEQSRRNGDRVAGYSLDGWKCGGGVIKLN